MIRPAVSLATVFTIQRPRVVRFAVLALIVIAAGTSCADAPATAAPAANVAASKIPALFRWTEIPGPSQILGSTPFRLAVAGDALIAIPAPGQGSSTQARPAQGSSTQESSTQGSPVSELPLAVRPRLEGQWREATMAESSGWPAFREAAASGAALISADVQLLCLGGERDGRPVSDVFSVRLAGGALSLTRLPPLPQPAAGGAGAFLGGAVYLFATIPASGRSTNLFWKLDLSTPAQLQHWETLPRPPGSALSRPIAVAQDGSLLLLGGLPPDRASASALSAASSRAARFIPGKGWRSITAPPESITDPAAVPIGESHVLVANRLDPARAFAYHTITNTWRPIGLMTGTAWPHPQPQPPAASKAATTSEATAAAEMISWQTGIVAAGPRGIFFGQPQRHPRGLAWLDIAVLNVYLVLLILLAIYFARRGRGSDDYFLAGRRIPWWAAGLSLLGTSISSITFMAIPALVYRTDWVYLLGNLVIVAVAPPVIWYYLPFYRRLQVTSAYEYLERRFGLAARLTGSATFLAYQLGRLGIVVYLPSLALSVVTGWNVYACILGIGLLATLYTTLGGIEAVIWTDVVQMIVLAGGAFASLAVIVSRVPGGAEGIIAAGMADGKFHAVNLTWSAASTGVWVVVVGNFFKFLIPYSSDQAVIQRYLTTKDEKQAARGIWLNAAASVPVWTTFFALGTALWAFYQTFPERIDPLGSADEIFAWFIVNELPPGIAGLLVAALFAASMSSLDSGLNSMATAITTDFYRRFRPAASDRSCLRLARLATLLLGMAAMLLAAYMAVFPAESVWDRFLEIMGLFGGGLGGMFMAGIFTRRTSQTGILIGFAASAVMLYAVRSSGAVHFFLYGAIGIFTCAGVGWLASHLLPAPRQDLTGLTIHSLRQTLGNQESLSQTPLPPGDH